MKYDQSYIDSFRAKLESYKYKAALVTTGENSVVRTLLFGRQGFTGSTNKEIVNATISFVLTTERFNSPFFF